MSEKDWVEINFNDIKTFPSSRCEDVNEEVEIRNRYGDVARMNVNIWHAAYSHNRLYTHWRSVGD